MPPTVMTVRGPIDPSEVGRALLHEHVLIDLSAMAVEPADPDARRLFDLPITLENLAEIRWSRAGMLSRANTDMSDVDEAVEELADLRAAGGGTVAEMTPIGMRRDVARLPSISERSGIHIVAGSAFFVESLIPVETRGWDAEQMAAAIEREFHEGIEDTAVRPGMIGEVGTSAPVTDIEKVSLRAAVLAANRTGMAINVHLDPWAKAGLDVVDVLERAGADPSRVVIGHLNPTLSDLDYHRALARRGVILGYDLCGYELVLAPGQFPPRDWDLAVAVAELVGDGFGGSIVLAHDTSLKTDYLRYGGKGYGHILRRVVPLLTEQGISSVDLETILTGTPRRLLTLGAPV